MIFKPLSSNARTHLLALEVFLDTLFCKKEEGLEELDIDLDRGSISTVYACPLATY